MIGVNNNSLVIIAAVDQDRGFSANGKIPWHHPEDFAWFKQQTSGHICIVGKNTYEDINQRRGDNAADSILPDRKCFVVSSTLKDVTNAIVIPDISAFDKHTTADDAQKKVFVIGGGRLFTECIAIADQVLLTVINDRHGCDLYFPVEFLDKHFVVTSVEKAPTDEKLRFVTYSRKTSR